MVTCPKSKEPVVDRGDHYFFPGYPELRCMKHVARAELAAMDYVRILLGHSPLFCFYSSSRDNYFEARLRLDPATHEFRFEYETPNPPPVQLPRTQFADYLKIVYPSWQYTPQKLHLCTLPQVEYMADEQGNIEPRAVIEYVKVDKDHLNAQLKSAGLARLQADSRCKAGLQMAHDLGVKYFILLHTRRLIFFSLYNLSEGIGWNDLNTDGLQEFYQSLTVTK